MLRYRNVRHGGIVERHGPDEWLEASAGWERVVEDDELELEAPAEDDTNERTDTE